MQFRGETGARVKAQKDTTLSHNALAVRVGGDWPFPIIGAVEGVLFKRQTILGIPHYKGDVCRQILSGCFNKEIRGIESHDLLCQTAPAHGESTVSATDIEYLFIGNELSYFFRKTGLAVRLRDERAPWVRIGLLELAQLCVPGKGMRNEPVRVVLRGESLWFHASTSFMESLRTAIVIFFLYSDKLRKQLYTE